MMLHFFKLRNVMLVISIRQRAERNRLYVPFIMSKGFLPTVGMTVEKLFYNSKKF